MLQRIPAAIGRALHSTRAGLENIVYESAELQGVPTFIEVGSTAFEPASRLPLSCTADGEGISPDLYWEGVPPEARSLILLVEDADSPTPRPLVHALAFTAVTDDSGVLPEGALAGGSNSWMLGRNSWLRNDWLPCDPPPGHGIHRYCFQLFALDRYVHNGFRMGRKAAIAAMRGHVVGKALVIGTYSRDEDGKPPLAAGL